MRRGKFYNGVNSFRNAQKVVPKVPDYSTSRPQEVGWADGVDGFEVLRREMRATCGQCEDSGTSVARSLDCTESRGDRSCRSIDARAWIPKFVLLLLVTYCST